MRGGRVQRVRAINALPGDQVEYRGLDAFHWSWPIETVEELPETSQVRFHLHGGLTMLYRAREKVRVMRRHG